MLDHLTTIPRYVVGQADLRRLTHYNSKNIVDQYHSFILHATVDLAPSTAKDYSYKLRAFIKFCLKSKVSQLEDIGTDHIRGFIVHMQQSNSPKSVNGYFKVVQSFFGWLVYEGRLESNTTQRVKAPKVPHKIVKIFRPDHIRDILLLCGDGTKTGVRNKAMVLVLLDTGLRLSELVRIQVDDIDIKRGIITVMGKGAKQRVVGICKATIKAIIEYYESSAGEHPQLWLTEEGKPLTYEGISSIFKTLKRRAGFKDVRLSAHIFRHTSGTMALLNGATQREVQDLLGHSTPRMTQEYTANINSQHAVLQHKNFSPVGRLGIK